MAKTSVNKTEALALFPSWTKEIKALANEHFARLGVKGFNNHNDDYVSCVDKDGKVVMYLTSSQFQWRKADFAPEGAEIKSGLYFEPTGAERPKKASTASPAKKVAVKRKKVSASDVDAALADA